MHDTTAHDKAQHENNSLKPDTNAAIVHASRKDKPRGGKSVTFSKQPESVATNVQQLESVASDVVSRVSNVSQDNSHASAGCHKKHQLVREVILLARTLANDLSPKQHFAADHATAVETTVSLLVLLEAKYS